MPNGRRIDGGRRRVAAAVCAHNDAAFLADAVASLMRQTLPERDYEVVVVDNASTDDTGPVLCDLQGRYGRRLRVCWEERTGLSHARNLALAVAGAPIVAFIDADAVADPGWLEGILAAFRQAGPVAVVGGPVRIRWDQPRPRWWSSRLDEALNAYEPGREPMVLGYPRYPYGTNFALRVDAAGAVGGFATVLGRCGRTLGAGEEGELCLRLARAGWEIRFAPDVVVHHRTVPDRLSRRYVLRRAFNHGRSQYMIESMHGFESGRYGSWTDVLGRVTANLLRLRCDLPFLKFTLFRAGYQYERTRTRASASGR